MLSNYHNWESTGEGDGQSHGQSGDEGVYRIDTENLHDPKYPLWYYRKTRSCAISISTVIPFKVQILGSS